MRCLSSVLQEMLPAMLEVASSSKDIRTRSGLINTPLYDINYWDFIYIFVTSFHFE